MNERNCSSPIDPPQQVHLDRVDYDRTESDNHTERVSGNAPVQPSPTRQSRIQPWRWQVR